MILDLIPSPYRALAKFAALAVAVIGLMGVGAYIGSRNESARHEKTKAEYARALQDAAEMAASFTLRIREQEAASAGRIAEIDAKYQEALTNARTKTRDEVLRDLRSGRITLSLPVRAKARCESSGGQALAASAERDGGADSGMGDADVVDRSEVERRVAEQIGIARRADEQIGACQAVVREYLRLTEEVAAQ